MRHFPFLAAAALFAFPVMAQDQPVLSQADADMLLARLDGNLAAIVERSKPAMALLDDLLVPSAISDIYAEGTIDGLESISWHNVYQAMPEAYLVLAFGDMDHAERFRDGLDALSGVDPDPSCTSATTAHWIIDDDLSLALRFTDYTPFGTDGWVTADLTIVGGPPRDANCSVTSATDADIVDPAQLVAFFERLRDDPIDLSSADTVRAWIAPYGASEYPLTEDCGMGAYIESPQGLSANGMLMITLPDCNAVAPSAPIYLSLGGLDIFAFDKLIAAADTVFSGVQTCTVAANKIYAIAKDHTLAVMDASMDATAITYSVPIEDFDCED